MLLKSLRLQNIRSYLDSTVHFPPGIVMLSGDIGSGKSSLLLAIEFALFGAQRGALPAHLLLRKGVSSGSVELHLDLQGDVKIWRGLKQTKQGIAQTSGWIERNGTKKELTPVELRSEVWHLLGYPEALVGKESLLFRYTVYTPQEAMRMILADKAETRLHVLRQLFGVEKYKIVRDNVALYLRSLRKQVATFEGKIESLPQKKAELAAAKQTLEAVDMRLQQTSFELTKATTLHQAAQHAKETTQQQEQLRQRLATQITQRTITIAQYQKNQTDLFNQIQELKITIKSMPLLQNPQKAKADVQTAQQQWEKEVQERAALTQKESFLHTQLKQEPKNVQPQLIDASKRLATMTLQDPAPELQKCQHDLQIVQTQTAHLNTQIESLNQEILRIETLTHCPTCLQDVGPNHKSIVQTQAKQKVEACNQQRRELLTTLTITQEAITQQQQRQLAYVTQEKERHTLEIHQAKLVTLHEQYTTWTQQASTWKQELGKIQQILKNQTNTAQSDLIKKQNILEQLNLRTAKEEQYHIQREQYQTLQQTLSQLQQTQTQDQQAIANLKNMADALKKAVEVEAQTRANKTKISLERAAQLARRQEIHRYTMTLTAEVNTLMGTETELIRLREIVHWLGAFFIPLTGTIERQVMAQMHRHFTGLFLEWLGLLLSGSSAQIDDTFTPLLVQQGFELPFMTLSGGEKTAIALAYRLALNRVVNDLAPLHTHGLLILDEPTEGFSNVQLDTVRDVLEQLQLEQIIIVSHEAKIESFVEHVIRIEKQNHVSSVV